MVAATYPYPQYNVGPIKAHPHHHVSSGRKHAHASPFYQSTNHTYVQGHGHIHAHAYANTRHPLSPLKRVPGVNVESALPRDQTDLRVRLFQQLRDGSLASRFHGGFPFRHTLVGSDFVSGRGKARVSYEPFDIRLATEDFGPNENVGIVFKAPTSTAGSSSRYFTWQVYVSSNESRSHGHCLISSSSRTILAQVRVDPSVMHTPYGKFLRTDPGMISRALAISLELGVLLTIVSADEESNACSSSTKLLKSMLGQKRRGVTPEYWAQWDSFNFDSGEDALSSAIARDSILYIGTNNHGCSDVVYTYPS